MKWSFLCLNFIIFEKKNCYEKDKQVSRTKKRKAKNDMAEGCLTLIWNILKYTIFLPVTIL
tara:strand:+ start:221 stop:403 length:183 start_codon:yes stop_codon:yes gene_type:complete